MDFRCGSPPLCFNEGTCIAVDNSTRQVCACPNPSFGPDTSFFHHPNCALPNYFYLAQFVELSLVSWIPIMLLARKAIKEKGRMFWCALWSIGGTLSIWLFSLGVFVQNG